MDHESFQEKIALRLYDELDETERRDLERHLEGCAECRRFAGQMEQGLGRIAASSKRASDELPPDWTERLREAGRTRARALPIWTAAAGFAAGLVATAVLSRPAAVERAPTTWERFHTDAPPPLATTEGQLARLGEYLRR